MVLDMIHYFGYDPLFWDFDNQMTAAEMDKGQKSAISHRGQACEILKNELRVLWGN